MSKYHVKHKRQSIVDFLNDIHRFKFWYNGEKEATCVDSVSVFFNDENIPEDVKCEIQKEIYDLIDKNERTWSVPNSAYDIADTYCAEEYK